MNPSVPPNHLIPHCDAFSHERLTELATRFGTPLFVYDAGLLACAMNELASALPPVARVLYSVKANPSIAIIEQFASRGVGFEVASIGELGAVLRAGGDAGQGIFVGPGKRDDEIESAAVRGIGILVAESPTEVQRIARITKKLSLRVPVLLRINPGLPQRGVVGEGPGLAMGGRTQFGMTVEEALALLQTDDRSSVHLDIQGVHAYLGTRILDYRTLVANTELILETAATLQRNSGRRLRAIDVGGGFGVPCYRGEQSLDLALLRTELDRIVGRFVDSHPWTETVYFESGRFLTARAGVLVCSVIDVKPRDEFAFVIVDGGAGAIGGRDGYAGARPMPVELIGPCGRDSLMSLCGPLCTPIDRVAANVVLPLPSPGSLVVFYLAGAYSLTASAGMFLSHGCAAEVLIDGQREALVRERQDPICFIEGQYRFGDRS